MKIILFSSNMDTIDEWVKRHGIHHADTCQDTDSLIDKLEDNKNIILIADYDSVASEINNLISSYSLPKNLIVLERVPEIATGKMLIRHGIKAYGNSRMLSQHYKQMLETVTYGNIWTYPELTAALVKTTNKESLNSDALQLVENRLSAKELEVIYLMLNGLTNDAIASAINITTRTVKAHVSSIFSKLHVNDRVSLILLLK
ncbi:response regulator transcription factor [Candidatus Sulfurimonas baltica]|uniref:Response regulator transcription factor n=1 Tax=Candidatus Sulfurimonas baltica TaxID=2740404 RepID=A0A7S7RMX7_9BACT|nr:LuxR C-terminal-related transcriptional regulator [Candidatus Sulfurimonas baltica]QOY52752.1 response regulator transcription factor [Candidatus Sulfurimonas baltica]